MRKGIKVVAIFTIASLLIFSYKVYAESYGIFLKTDSVNMLKNGDTIILNAGIACASNDIPTTHQKFTLLFDKDVFEMVNYDNNSDSGFMNFKPTKIMREGWEEKSSGFSPGQYNIELEATSSDYYITEDIASNNCLDSVEAGLVSFKLKVKNTTNQKSKIQIINEDSYNKSVEFTIHNSSNNNYLSSLKIEGYELDKNFNKNNTEYEAYVPYNVEKVNIIGNVEDNSATLSGTGEKQLVVGDNKISLVVTAENGTKKTYIVNVIRKDANDDTSLSKIEVTDSNKNKVSLVYDEKTKTYTGDISSEITFVSFDIKCSGEDCFVEELSSESVKYGKNEFKFKVVSQNGNTEEYKIIINKEEAKKDNLVLYLSVGLGICASLCVVLLILCLKNKKR